MSINRIALIVGVLVLLIIAVWGFFNIRPLLGGLFGGKTGTVLLNSQKYTVEIADTPEKLENGLSRKKSLSKDRGMLFVFKEPGYPSFWMKEMQFPLDIIFINNDKVTTVYENVKPPESDTQPLPLYKPTSPSDKALEINAGQIKEHGIKPGDTVQIDL